MPRCLAFTASMFKIDNFGLDLVIMIPSFVLKFLSNPVKSSMNVHQILIGTSPLVMVQTAVTASSRFISSSPKLIGFICGKTMKIHVFKFENDLQNSERSWTILRFNSRFQTVNE